LGFVLQFKNNGSEKINLDHSFVIEKSTSNTFHDSWKPIWGTDSLIENWYTESIIHISNSIIPNIELKIVARAYNNGVAFRYHLGNLNSNSIDSVYIFEELTQFNFASNDSAWFAPASDFAYESIYKQLPLSEIKDAATPITICRNNKLTISIHEAQLVNYSEFFLVNTSPVKPNFISKLWPEPDGVCARISLPFQTPWRVILISETPGKLIESHLIQNLNEPSKIVETDWIQPIKFIGIWWGMHTGQYTWMLGENHGATTERTKQYIDFVANHNIQGVLAEGWNEGWETWNSGDFPLQNFSKGYPDFDLQEVTKYARNKNVHFVSHHETGGNIPEYERQLDSAFLLCNQLGIRYLKTGYAGKIIPLGYPHHGQYMVNHFQKVVEKAAEYQICLNVHESIKPTGLDRTWPNLMTQEAIRGNEWNGGYKPTPPSHTTILPFTRYIAGPADYTPGIFNTKHSPDKGKRLFTTRAHQMALMVVFFSPMAMVSDNIENYEDQPEFKFMEDVPSSWDATKVLSCEIGKYISIARKKEQKWYVGSITNQDCRILSIPLHFLEADQRYLVTIYGDGFINDWKTNPDLVEIDEYIIHSTDSIMIFMSQGSGNVMVFEPIDIVDQFYNPIYFFNTNAQLKYELFSQKEYQELGQSIIKHKGYLSKVEYKTLYNQKYCGDGNIGLTNGKLGNYNFFEEWQGFEGKDIELIIDLDSVKEISSVEVRFMDAINDWIFAPISVTLWISVDGDRFEKGETIFLTGNELRDYNIVEVKKALFQFSKKGVRAIKITTESQTICPEWHYGSGKSCWTFMDEIIIN
jgi:alpha-glucosidase